MLNSAGRPAQTLPDPDSDTAGLVIESSRRSKTTVSSGATTPGTPSEPLPT